MPKGPKGEKRPADVIGAAVMIGRIATGDVSDDVPNRSSAAELGSKGGKSRAKGLTAKKRSGIARKAAAARWRTKR